MVCHAAPSRRERAQRECLDGGCAPLATVQFKVGRGKTAGAGVRQQGGWVPRSQLHAALAAWRIVMGSVARCTTIRGPSSTPERALECACGRLVHARDRATLRVCRACNASAARSRACPAQGLLAPRP